MTRRHMSATSHAAPRPDTISHERVVGGSSMQKVHAASGGSLSEVLHGARVCRSPNTRNIAQELASVRSQLKQEQRAAGAVFKGVLQRPQPAVDAPAVAAAGSSEGRLYPGIRQAFLGGLLSFWAPLKRWLGWR